MTVARITTINFKSKEDAEESIKDYSETVSYTHLTLPTSDLV